MRNEDITNQTVLLYMLRGRIITEFSVESIKLIFSLQGDNWSIYTGGLLLVAMSSKYEGDPNPPEISSGEWDPAKSML